ncbi:MAG TPA: glycosyltransferase family 1 protein [Bacteroidetes bacterium]|nr:glycosyltransferase family 1 protein [Bacteroidota bacterium]
MKFFLSFLQSPVRHPVPAYDFWEHYLKNGIKEAGHEWMECPDVDWAKGLVPQSVDMLNQWRADAWEQTINYLKNNRPDVFLSYLYPHQVDVSAVKQIQKMGIPAVNFFCDNVREFKKAPKEFGVFDLNWVPEYKALEIYEKAGYNFIHLPMPMWVAPEYRGFKAEVNQQITFIGSKDIQRHLLLEELIKLAPDTDLAVYGSGWQQTALAPAYQPRYGLREKITHQVKVISKYGVLGYAEKIKQRGFNIETSSALSAKLRGIPPYNEYNLLTSGSMITLGVNRYPSYAFPLRQPDTYSRLRDIEAPMLGACYLTEWAPGLDQLYELGNEIETYKTAAELSAKIIELKNNPEKRKKLKINGQHRALTDHCIPQTLKKILCRLPL